MFFVKKLISAFLLPSSLSIVLILAGLLLQWLTSRTRLGRLMSAGGLALLLLASYSFVADAFLAPLEGKFAPLFPREALLRTIREAGPSPRWIVVLSGGHVLDPHVPANDQLGDSAMARLVEGIRVHREIPGSRLLISGGVGETVKHADVLARVALILGVSDKDFVLDRSGWDTEQEASNLAPRVGKDPFVLVTSAVHMPRAMALFRRAGTRPIPAPTHHFTLDEPGVALGDLFPSPGALSKMDAGVHEYLGLAWSKLRGRL